MKLCLLLCGMSSAALVRRSTQGEAEEVETKVAPKVLLEVADDDCAMWFESDDPGAGMVIAGCMTTCSPDQVLLLNPDQVELYDDFGTMITLQETDPEKRCEIVTKAAECIKMPAVVEAVNTALNVTDLCPTIKSCFLKEACLEQDDPLLVEESNKVETEVAPNVDDDDDWPNLWFDDDDCAVWFNSVDDFVDFADDQMALCMTTCGPDDHDAMIKLDETDPEKYCEDVTQAAECIKMPAVVEGMYWFSGVQHERDLQNGYSGSIVPDFCSNMKSCFLKEACPEQEAPSLVREKLLGAFEKLKVNAEEKLLGAFEKLKVNAEEKEIDESAHRVGQEGDNTDLIELATEFPGHGTISRGISTVAKQQQQVHFERAIATAASAPKQQQQVHRIIGHHSIKGWQNSQIAQQQWRNLAALHPEEELLWRATIANKPTHWGQLEGKARAANIRKWQQFHRRESSGMSRSLVAQGATTRQKFPSHLLFPPRQMSTTPTSIDEGRYRGIYDDYTILRDYTPTPTPMPTLTDDDFYKRVPTPSAAMLNFKVPLAPTPSDLK